MVGMAMGALVVITTVAVLVVDQAMDVMGAEAL